MSELFANGDRVKYTYTHWHFKTHRGEKVKVGTFLRYSKGRMYTSKMVIQFDGDINRSYLSKSSNVIKI